MSDERVETELGWAWREGNEIRVSTSKTGEATSGVWCPGMEAADWLWSVLRSPTTQDLEEQYTL